MERETREYTIAGRSIIIKTYVTAREHQAIQGVYFTNSKVEVQGESYKINDFNPSIKYEVEKEMIKQLVVSVNAVRENIVDLILDTFTFEEYAELVKVLDELTSKKK